MKLEFILKNFSEFEGDFFECTEKECATHIGLPASAFGRYSKIKNKIGGQMSMDIAFQK